MTRPDPHRNGLVLDLLVATLPALILALTTCSGPAHAQDSGPPCAVLLAAERADHAADLVLLAAELRRVEAAVAEVPDPPSRVVWLAAGVGVGLILVLGVQAAE